MLSNAVRKSIRVMTACARDVAWLLRWHKQESVYFYTFHKCASSLFSQYVLKNISGLKNINYAARLFRGENINTPEFREYGYIYGPLRLSGRQDSATHKQLLEQVTSPGFIKGRTAVFLIRDPRDMLVSAYYSFGYSHGYSQHEALQHMQQETREQIQSMSIDEYVLDAAPRFRNGFDTMETLVQEAGQQVILRYEDMIDDWEHFETGLTRYLTIRKTVLKNIYHRTRPVGTGNPDNHRRSGVPGNFRDNLQESTIATLNTIFSPVLKKYNYTT